MLVWSQPASTYSLGTGSAGIHTWTNRVFIEVYQVANVTFGAPSTGLGVTNFADLSDVTVPSRQRGEQPWYDGTTWRNTPLASPTANMGEWEEAYTACATTTTQTPFTSSQVNSGQSGNTPSVMGRQGVWKASSKYGAVDLFTGAVFAGGLTSTWLTNRYNAKADVCFAFTNNVIQYVGYSDGLNQAGLTNAPTDSLMVTVTNGTARFVASQGGFSTVAATTFTFPTNIWPRLEFDGTNQVAFLS